MQRAQPFAGGLGASPRLLSPWFAPAEGQAAGVQRAQPFAGGLGASPKLLSPCFAPKEASYEWMSVRDTKIDS